MVKKKKQKTKQKAKLSNNKGLLITDRHENDDMYMACLSEQWNQSETWTARTDKRSPSKRENNMPVYNLEGYVGWWRKSGRWNRRNLSS